MDVTALKQQAAEFAVQFIESGMVVGLGTGSTAIFATRKIGQLLKDGDLTNIIAIPTSLKTEEEAKKLAIPLTTLDEHPAIDLTIDGADEVAPDFNVIKGGGGALLREKIVAQATKRQIIVVDDSKLSDQLGTHWAIPIEVIPFGWHSQAAFLESLGAKVTQRMTDENTPYYTDQKNIILDCNFGKIANPANLAQTIIQRAGIVEHGLFINLAHDVIVAGEDGIRHLQRA